MASSSAHKQPHHLPALYGATAAPPPTPSALPGGNHPSKSDTTADLLSRLFHRLPPNLSLPSRRPSPAATSAAPLSILSFSSLSGDDCLLSASERGLFQLTEHGMPPELARSAELETLALFDLSAEQKESYFRREWPLGYEAGDETEDGDDVSESFCLDSLCSTESSAELPLASLREFTREMERIGLKVVDCLSTAIGFENPIKEDPTRASRLLWISRRSPGQVTSGGFYPYVIGLHYQIRSGQKYSLQADSGRVIVSPEVDSVMVTVGDIAQVWSNGKLKKVRGRPIPMPISSDIKDSSSDDHLTTMSLLLTLPLDSTVSPLLSIPERPTHANATEKQETESFEEEEEEEDKGVAEKALFTPFQFEDYAWRVYHERLSFKDPLDRYRI